MSFVAELKCVQCGRTFAPGGAHTCPGCGPDEGILDVVFDLEKVRPRLTRATLAARPANHWRYRELLPLDENTETAPEHIGGTPLIDAPRLAKAIGLRRLRLKDDTRSASASFKDRASSVGVVQAKQSGFQTIACASTGNAASSLAHCAAATGLQANIFVSARIPDGKLAQLLAYGARVFKVMGSYDEAYRLCRQACDHFGWYNRNAAVNPYLVEGKKTGGLEVAEQCLDDPPTWIAASVGDGCSIAGVWKGIRTMKELGLTNWTARMLGVQAEGVAPITAAFATGRLDRNGSGDTYADSINCPVPRNWRKAVDAVRESGGAYVNVADDEIRRAVLETGRLTGVFAEPAAATAVAGIVRARAAGILGPQDSVLAMITGNGLKDIHGAMSAVGQPHVIAPDFGEVERIVERESPSRKD